MIRSYNNLSLAFGVPGLLLQIGGRVLQMMAERGGNAAVSHLGYLILLLGTGLLLVGFAYYARAKRRSPAWCLMAFLSCIGLIVLACLKDHSGEKT